MALPSRDVVLAEIQAVLDRYPNGKEYDRTELILDVKHDLEQLKKRLGITAHVEVYLVDGQLVVRFGSFPNQN